MPKFRIGDKVRCISNVFTGENRFGAVRVGAEYVVHSISTDDTVQIRQPGGGHVGGSYKYPERIFELVTPTNRVSVSLNGDVVNRSNGTVTLKLASGEVVIIPESLAPVDSKILKYREIFSEIVYEGFAPSHYRDGKGDDFIAKLIAKHQL